MMSRQSRRGASSGASISYSRSLRSPVGEAWRPIFWATCKFGSPLLRLSLLHQGGEIRRLVGGRRRHRERGAEVRQVRRDLQVDRPGARLLRAQALLELTDVAVGVEPDRHGNRLRSHLLEHLSVAAARELSRELPRVERARVLRRVDAVDLLRTDLFDVADR